MNISILVKTFVAVFVLVDALGNVPIFLVLTRGMEPEQTHDIVNRASLVATTILLGFAFAGQWLLNYMDISMGSLQVAGGLLLLIIALRMLEGDVDTPVVEQEGDVAISPLALPLMAGPGTLTTVMLLMAESPSPHVSVVVGIVAAMLVSWIILRQAVRIHEWIGSQGAIIIIKLLGFLLAALAVEIGSAGIRELFLT